MHLTSALATDKDRRNLSSIVRPVAMLALLLTPLPVAGAVDTPSSSLPQFSRAAVEKAFHEQEQKAAAPGNSLESEMAMQRAASLALALGLDSIRQVTRLALPPAKAEAEARGWMAVFARLDRGYYQSFVQKKNSVLQKLDEVMPQALPAENAGQSPARAQLLLTLIRVISKANILRETVFHAALWHNDKEEMVKVSEKLCQDADFANQLYDQLWKSLAAQGSTPDEAIVAARSLAAALRSQYRSLLAGAYVQAGRYDDAERLYTEIRNLESTKDQPAQNAAQQQEESQPNAPISESLAIDQAYLYQTVGDIIRAREYLNQVGQSLHVDTATDTATPSSGKGLDEGHHQRFYRYLICDAQLSLDEGNYIEAEADYRKALELTNALSDKKAVELTNALSDKMVCMQGLLNCHLQSGGFDDASRIIEKSLVLQRAILSMGMLDDNLHTLCNPQLMALNLAGQSWKARERGDLPLAQRYASMALLFNKACSYTPGIVNDLILFSHLRLVSHDSIGALSCANQALRLAEQLHDPTLRASVLRTRSEIYLSHHELDKARQDIPEGGYAIRPGQSVNEVVSLFNSQGQFQEAEGDPERAILTFRKASALLEAVRITASSESTFASLSDNISVFDHLITLLVRTHRNAEAFNVLQRSRSRKMQEVLGWIIGVNGGQALTSALEDYRILLFKKQSLRARAVAFPQTVPQDLPQQIATLETQLAAARERVYQANPNYRAILDTPPLELQQVQKSLPDDAILLQYAPVQSDIYIFAVTRKHLHIVRSPVPAEQLWTSLDALEKAKEAAQTAIATVSKDGQLPALDTNTGNAQVAPWRANLTRLYNALISPVQSDINGKKTVLVIPTGRLYYLPFCALAYPTNKGLRYLFEDHPITILPGGTASVMLSQPHSAPITNRQSGGLTAFALNDKSLPKAAREVQHISKLFPPGQVVRLSSGTTTAVSFQEPKLAQNRYWHFSTHSDIKASPLDSGLLLRPMSAPGVDVKAPRMDHLTFRDILQLSLHNVDLVTLATCDSARGEDLPLGNEVTSLAQAFTAGAGAKAVLASLWQVPDVSADPAMQALYKELLKGTPKSVALQKVQYKMLHDVHYQHPIHWAGYILIGDWK